MDFFLKVAKQVFLKEGLSTNGLKKNCVVSPFSLNAVLNLAAAGSTGGTLEQFLGFLEAKSVEDLLSMSYRLMNVVKSSSEEGGPVNGGGSGGPLISFANGAWLDERFPLNSTYEGLVKGVDHFNSETKVVDFLYKNDEATKEVNSWVETATNGLIKDIVPSLDNDTVLVLANALYFRGDWDCRFVASMTKDRDFHLVNGERVSVPFMTTRLSEAHFYGSFNGFKLVKMPYRKGRGSRQYSMYIFLPNETHGLQNLIETFEFKDGLLDQLSSNLRKVQLDDFWIPKFNFSYGLEASDTFKEMGLTKPFDFLGEFTGMSDSPDSKLLAISKVYHKACVQVNEEGTVAAASTVVVVRRLGCSRYPPPPKPSFVADHPFMFIIREDTSGAVLFIGALLNPLLED